jgi:hypothetical protein
MTHRQILDSVDEIAAGPTGTPGLLRCSALW